MTQREKPTFPSPPKKRKIETSISELWENFKLPNMYLCIESLKERKNKKRLDKKIFEEVIDKIFQTDYQF